LYLKLFVENLRIWIIILDPELWIRQGVGSQNEERGGSMPDVTARGELTRLMGQCQLGHHSSLNLPTKMKFSNVVFE